MSEPEPRVFLGVEYVDDGCSLHPSCLACPLPVCRYDEPPGRRLHEQRRVGRQSEARALRDEGLSTDEIAARMGVSVRTAFRLLAPEQSRSTPE